MSAWDSGEQVAMARMAVFFDLLLVSGLGEHAGRCGRGYGRDIQNTIPDLNKSLNLHSS